MDLKDEYDRLVKSMVTFFGRMEKHDQSLVSTSNRELARILSGWLEKSGNLWLIVQTNYAQSPEKKNIRDQIAVLELELKELLGKIQEKEPSKSVLMASYGIVNPRGYDLFFNQWAPINQSLRYLGTSIQRLTGKK